MYKVRKIKFINHPIFKNMEFNFVGMDGKAVDTVIFAGENGCGKSTIVDELYKVVAGQMPVSNITEYEVDGEIYTIQIINESNGRDMIEYFDKNGYRTHVELPAFAAIFSDVDINFHSKGISTVTSMTLDEQYRCKRSDSNLPITINQLLIDIQALDDAEITKKARENPTIPYVNMKIDERMNRFRNAFRRMFDNLEYSGIDNQNGEKVVLFKKYDELIPIDSLSSGEKQIVYRGSFLLRDINALNGAFVFIDEPEISLHPLWQMKIMDFYKGIFTNDAEQQTSQMFVVTHSPFIIHNENRRNDKVIVLARDEEGQIIIREEPEYYKCSSVELVKDAFNVTLFNEGHSTIFLEGRTDEKYFNKALEVYDYTVPFSFRWVGYQNDNGQEENTGKTALDKAYLFLAGRNLSEKNVCLFDCDTGRKECMRNNTYIRVIPTFSNSKGMKKGIENALVLDDIDMNAFYLSRTIKGDYGDDTIKKEFQKMKFCNELCSMPNEVLIKVFANLKTVIDSLLEIFD
jgi:hypothetical protein